MQEPPVRATVIFRGHVQGVCFRATTCRAAENYPVTGSVENLPDGTVRLAAEGTRAAVTAFLAVVESEMGGYITGKVVSWAAPTGEFANFGIRR